LAALAEKMNAEIGGKSPRARRPAGVVANPKPLYPIDDDPPKAAALDALKPGDHIASASAPQIAGKAFTLSCRVETEQRDTIIVAHGGNTFGYALHLKGGRVIFAVRTGRNTLTEVESQPITGPVRIVAALARDGTMTLTVGGQAAATAMAPGLISRQPGEEFCVGHDNGQPVAKYGDVKPFAGKITELKVTTP
jgi:hypothetical protein